MKENKVQRNYKDTGFRRQDLLFFITERIPARNGRY